MNVDLLKRGSLVSLINSAGEPRLFGVVKFIVERNDNLRVDGIYFDVVWSNGRLGSSAFISRGNLQQTKPWLSCVRLEVP